MKAIFRFVFLLGSVFACDTGESVVDDVNLLGESACDLIPDSGPCMAAIPMYYFDKEEGKCKSFIWGGCHGVVPFETLEQCKACEQAKL